MRVKVYRNLKFRPELRYPAWSIATADSSRKLLDTVDAAELTNAVLVVEQKEQRRIKQVYDRTGKRDKKVHAFVVGDLKKKWPLNSLKSGVESRENRQGQVKQFTYSDASPQQLAPGAGKLSRIGYDPFISGEFVRVDCGVVVMHGELTGRTGTIWVSREIPFVIITPEGVYAKLGKCPPKGGFGSYELDYFPEHRLDNWNG